MKNKELIGSVQVLLAGLCWGFQNVYVKLLASYGLSTKEIGLIKLLIASVCFVTVLLVTNRNLFRINIRDIWMFIGTGIVSVTLYNLFGFYTAIEGGVGIAGVLCYTSPVFIMIMSAVFFKERITLLKIAAIVLTVCGCVLVAGIVGSGYKFSSIVIVTGVLSGLFYGLYTIFGRFALAKYQPLTVTTWTFVLALIGSLFYGNVPGVVSCAVAHPQVIVWGIALGALGAALPYTLYTLGLSKIESGKAAILSSFELVVGAVVGLVLFNEPFDLQKLAGMLQIICAIVLLNIKPRENIT